MAKKPSAAVVQVEETVADVAETASTTVKTAAKTAKAKFDKALDEARSGAKTLGKDLQDKAAATIAPYKEKLESVDLAAEAKAIGEQAKERALTLAAEGKTKASDALTSLGKVVAENAAVVDDKLGAKYGDYARQAARGIQEAGAKLDSKDLDQIGKEASAFVKKNPVVAAGALLVIGFALAKLFGSSDSED